MFSFAGFAQALPEVSPPGTISIKPRDIPPYQYDSDDESEDFIRIQGYYPNSLLFRVYDTKSASPLRLDEGFLATAPEFQEPISNNKWIKIYNKRYWGRKFRSSDDTREKMIEHVLGGWPGYTNREHTGPSIWVSATESFDWAIWEVVRRLVVLHRNVVGLALFANREHYRREYRGARCIVEDAADGIEAYGALHELDNDEKSAVYFSRASSEKLYLGRIPWKDIRETAHWKKDVSGHLLTLGFIRC